MAKREFWLSEEVYYFIDKSKWRQNTSQVIEIVKSYYERHQAEISYIIVASSTGYTGYQLSKSMADLTKKPKIIVVKMCQGCDELYGVKFKPKYREYLTAQGIPVLAATHALTGGIDLALQRRFGDAGATVAPTTIIAETLYLFSQGMKVAVEITMMAVDAELVPSGIQAIAMAGTSQGSDTAIVIRTASSTSFFDLDIHKVLCMPLGK